MKSRRRCEVIYETSLWSCCYYSVETVFDYKPTCTFGAILRKPLTLQTYSISRHTSFSCYASSASFPFHPSWASLHLDCAWRTDHSLRCSQGQRMRWKKVSVERELHGSVLRKVHSQSLRGIKSGQFLKIHRRFVTGSQLSA